MVCKLELAGHHVSYKLLKCIITSSSNSEILTLRTYKCYSVDGVVKCIVRCLVASLVSIYEMPGALPPTTLTQIMTTKNPPRHCLTSPGGKLAPGGQPLKYRNKLADHHLKFSFFKVLKKKSLIVFYKEISQTVKVQFSQYLPYWRKVFYV